jgi:hypothetical protein
MSGHEHYLELGALAAIGQISADEDRELTQHLLECHECRDAYSDYSAILHSHLPNASPVRFRLKKELAPTASPGDIRDRFLARARSEGADFSPEVEAVARNSRPARFTVGFHHLALATTAVIVVAGITASAIYWNRNVRSRESATLAQENRELSDQLTAAKQAPKTVIVERADRSAEQRVAQLQSQADLLRRRLSESTGRAQKIEATLQALQTDNNTLSSAHRRDQTEIQELQKQLAREEYTSASTIAALVEAQDKIKALNARIGEDSQRLAMEQQLSGASSDVRQLMGARNLHIIDVHDVNASGKSKKSFGRVFYSEGQSLVFYAFDLPTSKAKYFFKAWGQTEANERFVHDLGVFSIDDHEQRRWVLKVNDARLLKGVDSVFVTAEVSGDVAAPRGQRVLYAYLAGQANHP